MLISNYIYNITSEVAAAVNTGDGSGGVYTGDGSGGVYTGDGRGVNTGNGSGEPNISLCDS